MRMLFTILECMQSILREDWTGKESETRFQPLDHLPMALAIWLDSTDVLADGKPPIEGALLSTWKDKSALAET